MPSELSTEPFFFFFLLLFVNLIIMSQGSSSEKIDLPDNVKALFVDDVESTPWGPFIKATMVNGRSMEDPEVQELHQSKHLGF